MAPFSRATANGTTGGEDPHACRTASSWVWASVSDSLWKRGRGEISPQPVQQWPLLTCTRMITRTPHRCGIRSPRLNINGAFSKSFMDSVHPAITLKTVGSLAPEATGCFCLACPMISRHSADTSEGHSSTTACPTPGKALTFAQGFNFSARAANFRSSEPWAYQNGESPLLSAGPGHKSVCRARLMPRSARIACCGHVIRRFQRIRCNKSGQRSASPPQRGAAYQSFRKPSKA
mmetsp:Transcript_38735/g.74343  ORF Transcript_38735/g.74343 Transcript_38735/m.74343 type:complete len:234 (-) Transcript_38735:85-786(-)